jgi:hypothetical protein
LLERAREGDFALHRLVAELAESGLKVNHRAFSNFVQGEKLNFKNIAAAGERDRPDIANHLGQRRASIKTASSLSVRFSSTRHRRDLDPERHHGQSWQLQSHTAVHSRRWRQVHLPAQILAGPESDRADDLRRTQALVAQGAARFVETICAAVARVLADSSPTNAQTISKFFRLCVNLIAIMHNRSRGIKKDASEQHSLEKQKGFGVANHLSIAL